MKKTPKAGLEWSGSPVLDIWWERGGTVPLEFLAFGKGLVGSSTDLGFTVF